MRHWASRAWAQCTQPAEGAGTTVYTSKHLIQHIIYATYLFDGRVTFQHDNLPHLEVKVNLGTARGCDDVQREQDVHEVTTVDRCVVTR